MKKIISIYIMAFSMLFLFGLSVKAEGFKTCASWDTFCKNPAQIVATKCRLGVSVKHEQCNALGIPRHYLTRGGGNLEEGLPVTSLEKGKDTVAILRELGHIEQ